MAFFFLYLLIVFIIGTSFLLLCFKFGSKCFHEVFWKNVGKDSCLKGMVAEIALLFLVELVLLLSVILFRSSLKPFLI